MKNSAIFAYMAASAALVSATDTGGITINPDGSYTCAKSNAAYCAGDSLKTDIIIRCYGTRGVAGRCSNVSVYLPISSLFIPQHLLPAC